MYEVLTFYRAGLNKRISDAVTWDSAGFLSSYPGLRFMSCSGNNK